MTVVSFHDSIGYSKAEFRFPLPVSFMDESPRWLIVRGRPEQARRVLEKAARWNKRTLPPKDKLDNLFSRIYNEEVREEEGG